MLYFNIPTSSSQLTQYQLVFGYCLSRICYDTPGHAESIGVDRGACFARSALCGVEIND
jgi:hypothetical protein